MRNSRAKSSTLRAHSSSKGQSKPSKEAKSTPAYPERHASGKCATSAPRSLAARIWRATYLRFLRTSEPIGNWQVATVSFIGTPLYQDGPIANYPPQQRDRSRATDRAYRRVRRTAKGEDRMRTVVL